MLTKKLVGRPLAKRGAASALAVGLAGCASIPDITVQYRPVAYAVAASVVHTITCTRDKAQAIVARDGTFTPVYRADTVAEPLKLKLKDLDRFYADSDLTVAFTDDGRLKSINQSNIGQGETITKSLVSTVSTLGTASVMRSVVPNLAEATTAAVRSPGTFLLFNERITTLPDMPAQAICDVVVLWSAAAPSKELPQISVVQTGVFVGESAEAKDLEAGNEQASELLRQLREKKLDLTVSVTTRFDDSYRAGPQPIAAPVTVSDNEVPLKLQQTRSLALKAVQKAAFRKLLEGNADGSAKLPGEDLIKRSTITVPRPVTEEMLVLPIPKPALFGKQTFQLVLAESGRITTLGYGRTAGAPGALNAVTAIAGEETAKDAAEAAALKAAADLIAQQTRLSGCVLKPADCK